MTTRLLQSIVFASLVAGCTATGQVQYAGEADVQLVDVSPGVQVIADYDEPVFYSENYYWRYDNGVWYRSPYHTRGWIRVDTVPVAIRQIDQPRRYVHYHAQPGMEVRDHRTGMNPPPPPGPEVRDHRTGMNPPPPPPGPDVRDHRDEAAERHEQQEQARDQRQEAKDERKEQHEAAKEEHKEQKEERKEEHKEQKQKKDHDHRK